MRQVNTKTQAYANILYAKFDETAEETVIDGAKVKLWKGFIGKTCAELTIPKGMEQKVLKPLEELGCIEKLVRGVGNHPSVIALRFPPTEDVWAEGEAGKPLTQRPSYARLVSQVENIEKSLGGVNLREVLVNIENRLQVVEAKLLER